MNPKPKIAVIGAGLAGLTAALRLHQKNYDVTVYEARGRVGGRVLTVLMKNSDGTESVIEMGGQNITDGGAAVNLLGLAKELGLPIKTHEITLSSLVYWQGEYIDLRDLVAQWKSTFEEIDFCIDKAAKDCASMAELLETLFSSHPCLKMVSEIRLTTYEGIPVKNQSLYSNIGTLKAILKGGLALVHERLNSESTKLVLKTIEGGNAQLPLKIAEVLGNRVHLNKALYTVKSHNDQIELTFRDGTSVYYDKIIMAIPVSIYDDIVFDESILPPDRLQSFSKIGFGKIYKIVSPIQYYTNKTCRIIITDQQGSSISDDEKSLVMYCHQPLKSIAEQMNIAKKGYGIHGLPSSGTCLKVQDQHFQSYSETITHSWEDDVYAKGSYSGYCTEMAEKLDNTVDYNGITVKEVFEPINDRVFFIGEHTTLSETIIGTMEAAIESGERIARVFC